MCHNLKLTIYDHLGDIARGRWKNTKYTNKSANCEDRRGNSAKFAHGCPITSIDINSSITMMKRE
jgi:hypothetical protein